MISLPAGKLRLYNVRPIQSHVKKTHSTTKNSTSYNLTLVNLLLNGQWQQ